MTIRHRLGSYEVVSTGVSRLFSDLRPGDVVVTDENLDSHYRGQIPQKSVVIVIPAGEQSKNLATYERVCGQMLAAGISRSGRVFAFGGGVVGDLAGFVAATYMRGIPCVQCPTSLLAMVDSSVGGKVGVDTTFGKNLLGAFSPPTEVRIAYDALNTLPLREFINGTAEVWKYAFIGNRDLHRRLTSHPLTPGQEGLNEVIETCIAQKALVVEFDEFETNGQRATLNFGHTVGHAIELMVGYGNILHGEAISIGMVVETRLSERLGVAGSGLSSEVEQALTSQGLPTAIPSGLSSENLIQAMQSDKKASGGKLAFSLLSDLAVCKLYEDVPEAEVREVLATC